MKVAVYARYSSENQRDASIEDQFRNCQEYASRQRWMIDKRYEDRAISGSHTHRNGYQTLLQDAARHIFDVVLVDDLSRLSRDEAESIQLRKRFHFLGIRLIGVSDGYDSAAKGHKLQASVRGLMNELYLDDLRDKTHRGLMGQALKGFSCGGRTYGYVRVPIYDGSELDQYGRPKVKEVQLRPDPNQAQWVRWMFTRYAEGVSPREIAAELNRRKVPSPGGGTWCASAIRGNLSDGTGILCNPLYAGRYTWNRSRWERHPETKRRVRRMRDRKEWVEIPKPELTIVSEPLWKRVQARIQSQTSPTIQQACRQGAGRPGRYLFSQLLKCGICGANYVMADRCRYACASFLNRGEAVCANRLRVPRKVVEEVLLRGIQEDLFTVEGFAYFRHEVQRLLEERRRSHNCEMESQATELKQVEKEIGNLLAAIKMGILTSTTKAELERLEDRRTELLAKKPSAPKTVQNILPRMLDGFRSAIMNLGEMSKEHVAEAQRGLLSLLGGKPIILYPTNDGTLEAELAGDYAGLVQLMVGQKLNNSGCGGRI